MEKWKAFVNHAIELLDRSHGQEVKAFYQSIGVRNYANYDYTAIKADNDDGRYYYIDEYGNVDNITKRSCDNQGIKIVTLEEAKRIVNGESSIISTTPSINISTTKIIGRIIC
jgi:hypothetical protein